MFIVMLIEEWPIASWMVLGCSPCAIMREAKMNHVLEVMMLPYSRTIPSKPIHRFVSGMLLP